MSTFRFNFLGENEKCTVSVQHADWFLYFKNNDFEFEDQEHSGALKKFKDKEMEELLDQDSCQILGELSKMVQVESTVFKHLSVRNEKKRRSIYIGHKKNKTQHEIQWLPSEEIILSLKQISEIDRKFAHAKMFTCGEIEIGHIISSDVISHIDNKGFQSVLELAEKQHSDLVPGKYEGGLKIWECTNDLIHYLTENLDKDKIKGLNVLDLGCGAGILGIFMFMNGSTVTFQDYNKEVIEHVTIPNVLLNIEDEERETEIKKCKFYSGDWDSFNQRLPNSELYDVIVTSETIYNENNYDKIINLFVKRLKKDGVVYVAAKTYYFGVGGGTRQFEQRIKNSGCLQSELCFTSVGGIQREILKITHLKPT